MAKGEKSVVRGEPGRLVPAPAQGPGRLTPAEQLLDEVRRGGISDDEVIYRLLEHYELNSAPIINALRIRRPDLAERFEATLGERLAGARVPVKAPKPPSVKRMTEPGIRRAIRIFQILDATDKPIALSDLADIASKDEPDLTSGVLATYLDNFVEHDIIARVSKGLYSRTVKTNDYVRSLKGELGRRGLSD